MCPMEWRSPVDAKQALRAPTSTSHKRQEMGVSLMALLKSKSGLPWMAKSWGMKTPRAAITLFFHSLGREESGCSPHRYMVSLAQLSRRDPSVFLSHLGPISKPELPFLCRFQLIMIVTWVSWKTNLPGHVGSAGGSKDAK